MLVTAVTPLEELFTRASQSVHDRGWHDQTFLLANNPILMGEILVLGEEIGEYLEAVRHNQLERSGMELADCMMALISVAGLCGLRASRLAARRNHAVSPLPVAFGKLCRAIRRSETTWDEIIVEVDRMADAVWTTANSARHAVDLAGAIAAKLDADERRGYQHGGKA